MMTTTMYENGIFWSFFLFLLQNIAPNIQTCTHTRMRDKKNDHCQQLLLSLLLLLSHSVTMLCWLSLKTTFFANTFKHFNQFTFSRTHTDSDTYANSSKKNRYLDIFFETLIFFSSLFFFSIPLFGDYFFLFLCINWFTTHKYLQKFHSIVDIILYSQIISIDSDSVKYTNINFVLEILRQSGLLFYSGLLFCFLSLLSFVYISSAFLCFCFFRFFFFFSLSDRFPFAYYRPLSIRWKKENQRKTD